MKYGFLSDVKFTKTEAIDNGLPIYTVDERFGYRSKIYDEAFYVDAGFTTDLASTPSFIHWLLPPDGEYAWEAILHDKFYRHNIDGMTRKKADKIFLEGMKMNKNVNNATAYSMYWSVRLFGGKHYHG